MQDNLLLEQLDWCFTTVNWSSDFPNSLLQPLAKPLLDYIPCMVQIGTSIPKAQIFRFENFWIDYSGFFETVESIWKSEVRASNSATKISAKFKLLRRP